MYNIRVKLKDILKNHGVTAMLEKDVYETVLQRAEYGHCLGNFCI
jgi:hypothetical protein